MIYNIEFENTRMNNKTVKINGIYIHSKYNPVREAEQFIQKVYKENKFYVILGNGLGYYTQEMLKKISQDCFIVIEPIKELAQGENVFTFDNDLELERIIKREVPANKDINIITIPNYEKFFMELQQKIHLIVKDKLSIDQIFNNTVYDQTELWQDNFIRNLAFTKDDYNLQELYQKYNEPIIIASGGPSLDKQIPLLKQYREKIILIAAGSTITSLMNYDLEPDFIVVMDGKLNNYRLFEGLQFEKAQLVYSMVTHYKIREQHTQKCYSYFSSECLGLEKIYEQYTGNKAIYLPGGGSVSSYALSFARFISSGPIAFVGQDLSYTQGQSHAQSSKKFHTISDDFKKRFGVFETEGFNGEIVQTSHQFLAMKHVIEVVIEELENKKDIYNCTEAGLNIIGIPNLKLQDFLTQFTRGKIVIEDNNYGINNKVETHQIVTMLEEEISNLNNALKILYDNKSLLLVVKKKMSFTNSILKSLDKNDANLKHLFENSIVGISANKIMLIVQKASINNEGDSQFDRVYNTNMNLVSELIKLVENSIVAIKETINYLETESWNG